MTTATQQIDIRNHKDYIEMLVTRRSILKKELISIEAYLLEVGRLKRHKIARQNDKIATP